MSKDPFRKDPYSKDPFSKGPFGSSQFLDMEAPSWFCALKQGDVVYDASGMPHLIFEEVREMIIPGTGVAWRAQGTTAIYPDGRLGRLYWNPWGAAWFSEKKEE